MNAATTPPEPSHAVTSAAPPIRRDPPNVQLGSVHSLFHPSRVTSVLPFLVGTLVFGSIRARMGLASLVLSGISVLALWVYHGVWKHRQSAAQRAASLSTAEGHLQGSPVPVASVTDGSWVHLRGRVVPRVLVETPQAQPCIAWYQMQFGGEASSGTLTHAVVHRSAGGEFDLDDGSGVIARIDATRVQVARGVEASEVIRVPAEGWVEVMGFARLAIDEASSTPREPRRIVRLDGNSSSPVVVGVAPAPAAPHG